MGLPEPKQSYLAAFELNGWNCSEYLKAPRQYCRGAFRYLLWVGDIHTYYPMRLPIILTLAPLGCPPKSRGPWLLAALLTGVNGTPTLLPDNPLGRTSNN